MKNKILYLFLEPFIPGNGPYIHAFSIIKHLKSYMDILFFTPKYKQGKCLPGAFRRFFIITLTQILALFSLHKVKYVYIRLHFMGILFFLFAFVLRKKIIIEVNGPVTDAYVHWKSPRWIKKLVEYSYQSQLKLSTVIIVVTPQLKDYISKYYKIDQSRLHIIPNAAEKSLLTFNKSITKKLQSAPYVLYVGSLTKWQGLELLLEAAELETWPQDLEVYICGKGPLLRVIKEYMKSNKKIKYIGFVDPNEIHHYYRHSLLSIIPKNNLFNRRETGLSPIKLYESLAYGVPVIVTDIPYMADIVKQHCLGSVIPYDSPNSLAQVVKELYENPELRNVMSKNAVNFIINGNTWKDRAKQTYDIIYSL